jgi:hypothetical protein
MPAWSRVHGAICSPPLKELIPREIRLEPIVVAVTTPSWRAIHQAGHVTHGLVLEGFAKLMGLGTPCLPLLELDHTCLPMHKSRRRLVLAGKDDKWVSFGFRGPKIRPAIKYNQVKNCTCARQNADRVCINGPAQFSTGS